MPSEFGFALFVLGALALGATQIVWLVAGRRKNSYGVEGENLRLQPNKVALIGVLTALFLFLAGGAVIGLAAVQ